MYRRHLFGPFKVGEITLVSFVKQMDENISGLPFEGNCCTNA